MEGRKVTDAEARINTSREFRPGRRTIEKCLELSLEVGTVLVNGEERWTQDGVWWTRGDLPVCLIGPGH